MNWDRIQDAQIDAALDAREEVYSHPSPVRRVWGLTDNLIAEKHQLNVAVLFRRQDKFRLVDVGCGTGELISRLVPMFPHAEFVGIDSNVSSIEQATARQLPRTTFLCAPFTSAQGPFEIVICSEVFEHVVDTEALLGALRDLVVPGGHLSISTPSGWMYRTPRAYNVFKFLQSPARFVKLYLRPERNWEDAVTIHPAILPSRLQRRLEEKGFTIALRQSALWWLQQPGATYWTFKSLERFDAVRSASALFHWIQLLEAAMNVLPPLRYFESRVCLLMRRSRGDALHSD